MKVSFGLRSIVAGLLASGMWLMGSLTASADDVLGLHSLRSQNHPNRYIRHFRFRGSIETRAKLLSPSDASFKIVKGLADETCYSFQSVNYPGHFLRHSHAALVLHPKGEDPLFKQEATFCLEPGRAGEGISFTAFNHPDRYLRHSGPGRLPFQLWVDSPSGSNFDRDATFYLEPPIAKPIYLLAGDSITYAFPPAYLPGRGKRWQNRGVSGHQTIHLLGQIPDYSLLAKKIFLMIGINDLVKNPSRSPDAVANKIEEIAIALQQKYPNTPIAIQSVLPVARSPAPTGFSLPQDRVETLNPKIRTLNSLLKTMAEKQNGLQYVDLHSSFVDANGELRHALTYDGVHLNEEGYKLWGAKLRALTR